jgi:hypothetical protein
MGSAASEDVVNINKNYVEDVVAVDSVLGERCAVVMIGTEATPSRL